MQQCVFSFHLQTGIRGTVDAANERVRHLRVDEKECGPFDVQELNTIIYGHVAVDKIFL